ncbi:cellulose biosynthesis protein BcsQ [Ferrovum myxofaciens]|uniref:Cellulose synthase operon protein YhjQ n=1 Tax=Ferrovum myxofaciens TaxID=416213 RepID=A0A9E6MZ22_9PROT|nr:cellulose biosynthesis protein BcsQ [Ferrovum myxofaciens]QKE37936.1 MAG: cellulose synthase operon protein YhjQ [Ferrovum myxofaciens]QWY75628.1 MAG: cellulose synthase operon protein YhjQ [Ferrovum myxofaciens]QWY78364.1 MAG: cellulose synthase operon protein YhjQ [Ferrovum myxofaciens]
MKKISVVGLAGGVGVTTVVAQLSYALATRRQSVLAMDLSSDNSLASHLGLDLDESDGFVNRILQGRDWSDANYRNPQLIDFIPFGRITHEQERDFDQWIEQHSDWLKTELNELELPPATTMVFDCSRLGTSLQLQAVCQSDQVIMVLNTGLSSLVKLRQVEKKIRHFSSHVKVHALLNHFDSALRLDRDVLSVLRSECADLVIRVVLHRDEGLREVYAQRGDIFSKAPSSQAAQDFLSLATWLTDPEIGRITV